MWLASRNLFETDPVSTECLYQGRKNTVFTVQMLTLFISVLFWFECFEAVLS